MNSDEDVLKDEESFDEEEMDTESDEDESSESEDSKSDHMKLPPPVFEVSEGESDVEEKITLDGTKKKETSPVKKDKIEPQFKKDTLSALKNTKQPKTQPKTKNASEKPNIKPKPKTKSAKPVDSKLLDTKPLDDESEDFDSEDSEEEDIESEESDEDDKPKKKQKTKVETSKTKKTLQKTPQNLSQKTKKETIRESKKESLIRDSNISYLLDSRKLRRTPLPESIGDDDFSNEKRTSSNKSLKNNVRSSLQSNTSSKSNISTRRSNDRRSSDKKSSDVSVSKKLKTMTNTGGRVFSVPLGGFNSSQSETRNSFRKNKIEEIDDDKSDDEKSDEGDSEDDISDDGGSVQSKSSKSSRSSKSSKGSEDSDNDSDCDKKSKSKSRRRSSTSSASSRKNSRKKKTFGEDTMEDNARTRADELRERIKIEELKEKRELLYEFWLMEKDGMPVAKKYTPADDIDEMRFEYHKLKSEIDINDKVKLGWTMFSGINNLGECIFQKIKPCGISINGWADDLHSQRHEYEKVFKKIYKQKQLKYSVKPMTELLFLFGNQFVFFMIPRVLSVLNSSDSEKISQVEELEEKNIIELNKLSKVNNTIGELQNELNDIKKNFVSFMVKSQEQQNLLLQAQHMMIDKISKLNIQSSPRYMSPRGRYHSRTPIKTPSGNKKPAQKQLTESPQPIDTKKDDRDGYHGDEYRKDEYRKDEYHHQDSESEYEYVEVEVEDSEVDDIEITEMSKQHSLESTESSLKELRESQDSEESVESSESPKRNELVVSKESKPKLNSENIHQQIATMDEALCEDMGEVFSTIAPIVGMFRELKSKKSSELDQRLYDEPPEIPESMLPKLKIETQGKPSIPTSSKRMETWNLDD